MNLEAIWCALFISSHWYETWEQYKTSTHLVFKRLALKSKMIAIIEYDRVLINYNDLDKKYIDFKCWDKKL